MRIISGKFRGRRIQAPKNFTVRPTTDFAKEALFNILRNRVDFEHLKVLDLFAGIGGISFEFISRGVNQITAVESNPKHAKFIETSAVTLDIENEITTRQSDVFWFLEKNYHEPFSLIFADPPYNFAENDYQKILDLIFTKSWLNQNGILIIEHPKEINFTEHPNFTEERKYGKVHFSFFENS